MRRLVRGFTRAMISARSFVKKGLLTLRSSDVHLGPGVFLDAGVRIRVTDGGVLRIGRNVSVGRFSLIVVQRGSLVIGDASFVGEGVIIVATSSVTIGSDTLIAEHVTIRDQDHAAGSLREPMSLQGQVSRPVTIGRDVWLGAKVTVTKGVEIGAHAIVGANAVVSRSLPAGSVAMGVPAVPRYRRGGVPEEGGRE